MHLGSSILSSINRWVPVRVLLRTVSYIVTRFTTAVTVTGDCNLLRIFTSTTPAAPTPAAFWWIWSILILSGNVSIHSSGYSLTHHGLKRHRLSRYGSLISSRKNRFSIRYSRPRSRGPVFIINKFLVLGSSRPNHVVKFRTIHLRDQGQVQAMCLETKFRYGLILIQVPELKFRAGAPSQRTSQAREILRLEETSIV